MVKNKINQGDVLRIEGISRPIFVASKNYFNEAGGIMGCPIYKDGPAGALHIEISIGEKKGYVICEKMTLIDVGKKKYSIICSADFRKKADIIDAIQGIFEQN